MTATRRDTKGRCWKGGSDRGRAPDHRNVGPGTSRGRGSPGLWHRVGGTCSHPLSSGRGSFLHLVNAGGGGGGGAQPGLPGPRKTSLPDPKGVANSPAAAVLRTCDTLGIRKEAASLLEHVFPSRRTPVPGAGLSQVRACADHQGEKGFPFWVCAIEDGEPTRCFFLLSFWDYTWPSVKTHRCCGLPQR